MTHPTLEQRIERLEDLVQKLVDDRNPWAQFAGLWKDDPTFDDFLEIIAVNRRDCDADDRDRSGDEKPE